MFYTAVALRKLHGNCSTRSTAQPLACQINLTLAQQVLHIANRKRKSNIHHYSKPDDLRAGFEVAEWGVFYH